jgi:ABC-type nickel/cobalt efflux system permease component RcnA
MELSFPLLAGIIAAILHVISGPDHLAAVTPFAIESKKKAWKVGLFWGIGHLLGMLSIGILFLMFKDLIPIEKISMYSEKMVGVILIGLALWIFFKIFREEKQHNHTHIHAEGNPMIHTHPHIHVEAEQIFKSNSQNRYIVSEVIRKHPHIHQNEKSHTHTNVNLKQGIIASLSVGFVHGLAGVAHFLLFLPVIGFASNLDSAKYIVGFGIGTLLAMISFAFAIGSVTSFSKKEHSSTFLKGIRLTGGLFAFIIGIYWIIAN